MPTIDHKSTTSSLSAKQKEKTSYFQERINTLRNEIQKRIIGQVPMINGLLTALFANGHALIEGVPGLAKTLVIRSLCDVLDLDFKRIQFTPDLLPADLIGTTVFRPQTGEFIPRKGPIFSHILLADEVNRAPAKVQSAMLESMAERQVTIGTTSYELRRPFFVCATQNPIEQEGTYSLPEAQLDRFMVKIHVSYPSEEEEMRILYQMGDEKSPPVKKIMSSSELLELQDLVLNIEIDERIARYIVQIVSLTRPKTFEMTPHARFIDYGASPRATLAMARCARVRALFDARSYVLPEDVKIVVKDVLRHRISLSYEAQSESLSTDTEVDRIINSLALP